MMRLARLPLLALVAGCASATAPAPVVVGSWGGTQASLVLADSGGALQLPCAGGKIDSAWTLTSEGRFAAGGTYFIEAGPVPAGGPAPHPAHYVGEVAGDHLTLTITVPDLGETVGPLDLVRNGPPVRLLCL